ncbi:MAG TPA: hypothetical protein VI636_03730 [Candidatus Angelobacter sp.]
MPKRNDLRALRNMIAEAQHILTTTELPEGRAERARELLASAIFLADHLLETSPAAALGKKGGKETAKRGADYFRKIAAMRKEHKGGRPTKIKPN